MEGLTLITSRVVPPANYPKGSIDVFQEKRSRTKLVWAYDFKVLGDHNSPVIWTLVSLARIYVESGNQKTHTHLLTNKNVRNCTTEVWNSRCRGRKKYGEFMTPWEYAQHLKSLQYTVTFDGAPVDVTLFNKQPPRKKTSKAWPSSTLANFLQ